MARTKPDLEDLINTFQEKYTRKLRCRVCDSAHRELIEILMRAGHGGPAISRFLRGELEEQISQAVLSRHKAEHLDAAKVD